MSVLAPSRPIEAMLEIDLLSQSLTLRTALRRAVNAAGEGLVLSAPGAAPLPSPAGAVRKRALVVDADMPGLTGPSLMEHVCGARASMPVVVVASDTVRGRGLREPALKAGAAAFFVRPETEQPRDHKEVATAIVAALRGAGVAPVPGASSAPPVRAEQPEGPLGHVRPKAIVIGSSTGGPQALLALFRNFRPANVSIPILIVQHMPASFTHILAEHVTRATGWRAAEGVDGEPLTPGEIRIAPGGKHMAVTGAKGALKLGLTDDPPVNFCRPSADVLFVSAAALFGSAVLGVVLTGMGHDGADGAKAIKGAGGHVIAQDEASSVVWGMPGAAVATGAVDKVLPLEAMGPALTRATTGVS